MGHQLLQKMDKINKYKLVRIYLVLCSMLYNVQWRRFHVNEIFSSGTLKWAKYVSLQVLCLQASWKI